MAGASQFTVKVGTVFEHMRLPLHKALQAVYLVTSSKKGVSAHQLHRTLEITYKSAWFLAHKLLHRYVGEFEFRYNDREALGCNDAVRKVQALTALVGKRLLYRDSSAA